MQGHLTSEWASLPNQSISKKEASVFSDLYVSHTTKTNLPLSKWIPPNPDPALYSRRNRPPKTPRKNKKNENSSLSSLDFNNSFSSTTSNDRMHSSTGSNMGRDDDLDFLTKSPAAHRWINKKHWKTISVTKRYDAISTTTPSFSTAHAEERKVRRRAIRESLIGVLDPIETPDL